MIATRITLAACLLLTFPDLGVAREEGVPLAAKPATEFELLPPPRFRAKPPQVCREEFTPWPGFFPREDWRFLPGKPPPGLTRIHLGFLQAPQLDERIPWMLYATNYAMVVPILRMRNVRAYLPGSEHHWGFSIMLDATERVDGTLAVICCKTSSLKTSDHKQTNFRFGSLLSFEYESSLRHEGGVVGEPIARSYKEVFSSKGTRVERQCGEGLIRFGMLAEDWSRVDVKVGGLRFKRAWGAQEPQSYKGTITLRLCPSLERYYLKFRYDGHEAGNGWQGINPEEWGNIREAWLHLTPCQEEYTVLWVK